MDDIPQGGSGGVPPGPHDIDTDEQRDPDEESSQDPGEGSPRVRTVRAGVPVAEQPDHEKAEQNEDGADRTGR